MKYLWVWAVALSMYSCGGPATTEAAPPASTETITAVADNTLSEAEKAEGWALLFDGQSAAGWRGFNQDSLPGSWAAEGGLLTTAGTGGDIGGDIIYTPQAFDNFELYLEWKIEEAGNSGIFYHVQEGEQYHALYENAPEYQLLDDIGFPQELEAWQTVGADYGMYAPKEDKPVRPAGQWNSSRIRYTPNKVTYWLNGAEMLSFDPGSDDWQMRKEIGKWKDYPDYGAARTGWIGLQDHGSRAWFKNIKIRPL